MSLETLLARLLSRGTWLSSAVIACGLVLQTVKHDSRLVAAGVALFVALPILRVATMLFVYLRLRDYRFGAVAALVLAILALGIVLGARSQGALVR